MSFSKWIRGGSAVVVPPDYVDVGDTRYPRSGANSVAHLRHFLETGDLNGINKGFVWSTSPQGWTYWNERYEDRVSLSEEDFAFIEALVEHFESGGGSSYAG